MSSPSHPRRRHPASCPIRDANNGSSLRTTSPLHKSATFHSPISPGSSGSDLTFVLPHLCRSQSHMDDVVDANRRRIALTLNDIDEALSKTKDLSLSPRSPKDNIKTLRDTSLPIPHSFLEGPVADPTMTKETDKRALRSRLVRPSRHHASDSGLGTSIASTGSKAAAVMSHNKYVKEQAPRSAITRSFAPTTNNLPRFGQKAISRIHGHILRPLLAKSTLKEFEPIVLDIPRQIRAKEIICLRDLEKTLIFRAPERTKSAALYLDFCVTSVLCIQATVEYLSDREQIRPDDRPYTNGYFLDLKDQIMEYGKQLAAKASGDAMDVDASDEIKLVGGIAENGRPAELVRVRKDGTWISLETGKAVDIDEIPVQVKRSLSQQLAGEEEIQRSMARRKKNASPEELAPKRCREPGCNKEFKRPCDLTKHEKTHSRPWKCPVPTCKYHTYGWPTEKEMDRHHNDKHSSAPAMYECLYRPCPYKSKRESNCKQHMEKAHGWDYVRTKFNSKKRPKPTVSPEKTPANISTPTSFAPVFNPSPENVPQIFTPPQENNMLDDFDFITSLRENNIAEDFPLFSDQFQHFPLDNSPPAEVTDTDLGINSTSPLSNNSYEQFAPYRNGSRFVVEGEDLYVASFIPTTEQAVTYPTTKAVSQSLMYQPSQPCSVPTAVPHFSTTGGEANMLFTPESLRDIDETLDDHLSSKPMDWSPIFGCHNHMSNKTEWHSTFDKCFDANLDPPQSAQSIFKMELSNTLFQNLDE